MKSMICPKCHNTFILGEGGVFQNNQFLCDSCAGVVRDGMGYVWAPGELEKVGFNNGGSVVIVRRPDTLRIPERSKVQPC